MPIRRKTANIMTEDFLLRENPFSAIDIYNIDADHTYVPEVYGEKLNEFYEKFFLLPMENEKHKQVIGALWSSHYGGQWGKGFGKSMLMAEESKRINSDLGAEMLRQNDVEEAGIPDNPILCGYCSFDQAKGISSFPATLLEAVAFILESPCNGTKVHTELRNRIIDKINPQMGYEGISIEKALLKELNKYRGLSIQLEQKTLKGFIHRICHDDTEDLLSFIQNEIGPRIKASLGFNFVHVFNAYALLAGVVYIVYFVDQVENFSRFARNKERDIKILRESMCQTSPTANMASFIFQMHIHAQEEIEDWWDHIEHLPSLDVDDPKNSIRIVNLTGLTRGEAVILTERYLENYRVEGEEPPDRLHPFSAEIINAVCDGSNGNPREFLRTLGAILNNAIVEKRSQIDLAFVEPFLDSDYESDDMVEDEDDFTNPDR